MSNFERVPHDKLMTAFDCDADKVKSAEGFVGYLYRELAVPAQETSERELLAQLVTKYECLANGYELVTTPPRNTIAEYRLIVKALRLAATRAAGDAPAWLTDDELIAWARNWHWQDTAEDKPVDPSIYFRDARLVRAFSDHLRRLSHTRPDRGGA